MIERIPAGDRETWLRLRQRDVTASVAAALFKGKHPYLTAFELWHLKRGTVVEDPETTPAMERGTLLEPVAVELLRRLRPRWKITHNTGAAQVYLRDPKARIGATVDVFVECPERGPGVNQIKSVYPPVFDKTWLVEGKLSDPASWVVEPPLHVVIQAIVEAHLSGAKWVTVTPLLVMNGLEMPIVEVPLHEGLIATLRTAVAEFWASVEAGVEPEPDWSKDASLLNEMGRGSNGQEIDLSGDNRMPELLETRETAKAEIKRNSLIVEEAEAEIIQKLGAYERAYVPGWKVERPTRHRKGYEVKPCTYRQFAIRRQS